MSIFVNQATRVLIQGITGREGSAHARRSIAYGTKVVAGVTPGRGGESFEGVKADARHEVGLERWGSRPVRAALTRLDSIQSLLGRPHRTQVVTSRPPELTTLQAITLSNGPAFADIVHRAATALLSRRERSPEQRVERLFVSLLSRKPTGAEAALALEVVGPQPTVESVEDLLWMLLMLPEFQWIR